MSVSGQQIDGLIGADEWAGSTLLYSSGPGADAFRLFGSYDRAGTAEAPAGVFNFAITAPVAIGASTTIWLDTDSNTKTGYQIFGWAGGAEYQIEIEGAGADARAKLYAFDAQAKAMVFVADLSFAAAPDGTVLEVQVPQALIGGAQGVRVLADVNNSVFLPGAYDGANLTVSEPAVDDPGTRVAIVYSETTAQNYYNVTNYGQLFMAAQNQAMQAGIPFDVISEKDLLDPANLAKYDALIFPSFSHVKAGEVDAIAASLALAQQKYGVGLITSGNFMTNDETGAALAGNSYGRMAALLGVTREGGGTTDGISLQAGSGGHPILDGYQPDQIVGTYGNTGFQIFKDLTGTGQVLFNQLTRGADGALTSSAGVIATDTGVRAVHFGSDALLGNNDILGQAIRWVANDNTPDVSLEMTRGESLFYSRVDMDQAMERSDVSPDTGPGIYDAMLPILEKWYKDWGFTGSYYIDIGADPANGQFTDWAVSKPYYDRILALEGGIGSHSFTHPEDTSKLLRDTPEILALVWKVDPRNPAAVDPWSPTLSDADRDLLFSSFRFQFETSKLIIEQKLGITIEGAALPGAPEDVATAREIMQDYDYISGGFSGVGAGYPGAFGFVGTSEADRAKVYLAPNMFFDFTLTNWLKMTPEEATAKWLEQYEQLTRNANTPIISLPWHDYGVTNWEPGSVMSLAMWETVIARAAQDGTEFVTGADLASRIESFSQSSLTLSRTGDRITATVGSSDAGHFALDVSREGQIASVTGWYAYSDEKVFLPKAGGTFQIDLGATPADVTRVNDLGQRNELLTVTGDGTDLGFTFRGRSSVSVDLKDPGAHRTWVTGADDATVAADGDLVLSFATFGTQAVALDLTAGSGALVGGATNDILLGSAGDDQIDGGLGADLLLGGLGRDQLRGGGGRDRLYGGAGDDRIAFASGAGAISDGGAGRDTLVLTQGGTLNLALGANQMVGGAGIATGFENVDASGASAAVTLAGTLGTTFLAGGSGSDRITFFGTGGTVGGGGGTDTLVVTQGGTFDLRASNQAVGSATVVTGFENVDASAATAAVVLIGSNAPNVLSGGQAGDRIEGGGGRDSMSGGAGADLFVFRTISDSSTNANTRDQIGDFQSGADRIDLGAIDAIASTRADDAFRWGGMTTSVLANGVTWYRDVPGNRTIVQIDNDGRSGADMHIELRGLQTLGAADFVL